MKFDDLYESIILEVEPSKWSKGIVLKKGRMKDLLGLAPNEKVVDKYPNTDAGGKQLAGDLLKATGGNRKSTVGMLAFAANIDKGQNVLDKALKMLPSIA